MPGTASVPLSAGQPAPGLPEPRRLGPGAWPGAGLRLRATCPYKPAHLHIYTPTSRTIPEIAVLYDLFTNTDEHMLIDSNTR